MSGGKLIAFGFIPLPRRNYLIWGYKPPEEQSAAQEDHIPHESAIEVIALKFGLGDRVWGFDLKYFLALHYNASV